jgi:MoaA/NifB/PqqE/SkfB family radical SAM enzyme
MGEVRMTSSTAENLSFVWLEITGRCQLTCLHCYAESGPAGTHGAMGQEDWRRVIDQVAELGSTMVQFIGGEPTLHPYLPDLIAHAHRSELAVEVFTNLTHVTPRLWAAFAENEVSLACSYYSDDPLQHAAITGRAGSYARTRANIIEALSRSIPLRVGVIEIDEAQRVDEVSPNFGGWVSQLSATTGCGRSAAVSAIEQQPSTNCAATAQTRCWLFRPTVRYGRAFFLVGCRWVMY